MKKICSTIKFVFENAYYASGTAFFIFLIYVLSKFNMWW